MSSGWQQVEAPPLPVLGDEAMATLQALIAQGEAVLATKQAGKGRMIGDWQSVETVYAVVEIETFKAWRTACITWLQGLGACDDALAALEVFCRECARPQYPEALAGVKLLRQWAKG
jgi:hypothetical protein